MSQTKRAKKKISKRIKRRKAYVKERNRRTGCLNHNPGKMRSKLGDQKEVVDGAEFYRKLKEQEAQEKKPTPKKQSLFQRIGRVFTKGNK